MLAWAWKLVFVAGFVSAYAVRSVWVRRAAAGRDRRAGEYRAMEWPGLILDTVFRHLAPLVFLLTPWLDFADRPQPAWAGGLGTALFAAALWLLWRSHADLAGNWTPMVEVREGQTLVTGGVYRLIRNPMYLAHILWSVAQALLLSNWIAGFAAPFAFLPFLWARIPAEERLMARGFGAQYREWEARTGRLFPRLAVREPLPPAPTGARLRSPRPGNGADHAPSRKAMHDRRFYVR